MSTPATIVVTTRIPPIARRPIAPTFRVRETGGAAFPAVRRHRTSSARTIPTTTNPTDQRSMARIRTTVRLLIALLYFSPD